MRKIYMTLLSFAVVGTVSAQVAERTLPMKRVNGTTITEKPVDNLGNDVEKAILWSNDCSVEADWTYANTSSPAQDWYWTTDVNNVPAAGPVEMTTASNGYFAIDSDAAGNSANQDATITYTGAMGIPSLAANPNVVLEFEHHYRTYLDTRIVEFSLDGGTTWPLADTITDGTEANTNGGGTYQVNVSSMIGGQANIMIRFRYIGNWGWHWAIDDIRIVDQPNHDIHLLSAWVAGEYNDGTEYGRNPSDQMDANWLVGGEVFNFGANAQTNVDLLADFTGPTAWSSTGLEPTLASDATVILEQTETPTLSQGLYSGVYSVVSDDETAGGPDYGNNVRNRNFEVTDLVYSQDLIGSHPAGEEVLASLGTDSWTDGSGEDGFVLASWYHIKNTMDVGAIEIILANGTVEGGDLYVSLMDTVEFLNNSTVAFATSQIFPVTAADVAAGSKTVWFDNLVTLPPGIYYAGVTLNSAGGAYPIRVLDDATVAQPGMASGIYIAGDQTYSNGEAWGIRLRKSSVGLDEQQLAGIRVYPNPSEGVITVSNNSGLNNVIEISDIAGKVVATKTANMDTTFDLGANGAGVYMVKISNDLGSKVERVVIK